MIANLQPYPEYKESGLLWSPRLPAHWSKERAKWLFTKMDRPVGDGDGVVTCFRDGMVTLRKNRRLRGFTEAIYELGYQGIRKGDLVIHAMDAFAGAVGVSDSDGKATPVYAVCQPKPGVNAHYYAFIVREMARSQWILALSRGIRERSTDFRYETFGGQRVPLPPAEEQAAMVRFLDWANGRLERAIRAKRQVITLLAEQKQAIIHRAVTRGLDPTVPRKPSGIPWLGDIPQHWEVWPLKRLGWFKGGAGFPISEQAKSGLEIPFLKVSDMTRAGNEKWMESSNNTVSRETAQNLGAHVFPENAIIFPKVGGAMLTNKRRLLRRPSCIDNNVMGCIVRRGDLEFVFLLLQQLDLGRLSKPGPVPAISDGEVREIKVVFPPIEEQRAIVSFVGKETADLATAIARLEREIGLLREYRTRLVADVVTGKLDVRAAARQLPEEAEAGAAAESEALSEGADLSDSSDSSDEMPEE